ncbi:dynein axonemal intermediate chain 7-like isoform X4 [Vidua chalybeata]|uniref:dynein axonemal intermediate chain 7-like isoform X4 n=1 Tax=Vidua chalybeata TaxID=81927 RepID=UPI0023A82B17|nr:dynein axonemal intermediate chain 7-like isoform X4 [Vidua chalybeata]
MSVSLSTRLTLLSGELSRRGGPAAGGAKRQRRGTKSCGVAAAVALGGCVPHFCPAAATPGPGHRGLEHGGGQQWRTDGISKITYEAEEKSITFSMGAFYTVALLQDAHLNLPYQAWELHPAGVDEGLFTVTAVFATIQIQIKDNQCMLSSVVVEEEEMLSHITGKWMSPFALRAALKRAGVNIFPAEYSPKYVPVLRKVREHLTVMKVQNLKLPETSEAFSEEPEFHSTLYHMLKDSASSEAMDKVERAGFLFIDSVYQLLLPTRVLAYS